jgi:hypothetical protein
MLGKWHLCPAEEMNMASTKRNNVDIDYAGTSPYAFTGGMIKHASAMSLAISMSILRWKRSR